MRLGRREFLGPAHVPSGSSVRAVTWRHMSGSTTEVCRLFESAEGPLLCGLVTGVLQAAPVLVRYRVACTGGWRTRRADIELVHSGRRRRLALRRDPGDSWWVDGTRDDALTGLWDVDLGITPATNTLPVRQLERAAGSSLSLTAAWVRFPELTVRPLPQTYRALGGRRYRYESRGGAFAASLDVDDVGLVIRYPDLWERVGQWPRRPGTPEGPVRAAAAVAPDLLALSGSARRARPHHPS